jgi:hypothetical protein
MNEWIDEWTYSSSEMILMEELRNLKRNLISCPIVSFSTTSPMSTGLASNLYLCGERPAIRWYGLNVCYIFVFGRIN